MKGFGSISCQEMEESCYDDSLDMLKGNDVVGKWWCTLSKTNDDIKNIFKFRFKYNVDVDNVVAGAEMVAHLTSNLQTVMLNKYEFGRTDTRIFDEHTRYVMRSSGIYISKISYENNDLANKKFIFIPANKSHGFISEAAGMIFQRILARRKRPNFSFNFWTVNHNLDMCNVYYTTSDMVVKCFRNQTFNAFVLKGILNDMQPTLRNINNETRVQWKSYYNLIGRLVHHVERHSYVYATLPEQSRDLEYQIYDNRTTAHGKRYFYQIRKEALKPLLFSETKRLLYLTYKGNMKITIENASFKRESCILMVVSTFLKTSVDLIYRFSMSYLTYHLQTLECYEYVMVLKSVGDCFHKLMRIFQHPDRSVTVYLTKIKNSEVTNKMELYPKDFFDDFVSPASSILLQRTFAYAKSKEKLYFKSIADTTDICSLILKPVDNDSLNNKNSLPCEFDGVECMRIPMVGDVSVWLSYFLSNQELFMAKDEIYGLEVHSPNVCLSSPHPQIDCFTYIPVYDNGYDFLQNIDVEDILLLSFNEIFTIQSCDGEEIGTIGITIHHEKNNEDDDGNLLILIQCYGKVRDNENISRQITLYGKLTHKLDTLESVVEKSVSRNDVILYKSIVRITKFDAGYQLFGYDSDIFHKKVISSPNNGIPFISDAAEIILERILCHKQISDTLHFTNCDNCLNEWKVRYHPIKKQYIYFQGNITEMFGIQRTIYSRGQSESYDRSYYSKSGFCYERKLYSSLSELTHIFKIKNVYFDKTEIYTTMSYNIGQDQDRKSESDIMEDIIEDTVKDSLEDTVKDSLEDIIKDITKDQVPLQHYNSKFCFLIDKREVKFILFSENLAVYSQWDYEVGNLSITVSHDIYRKSHALLVQIVHDINEDDYSNGIRTSAYISLTLDVLEYHRFEYNHTLEQKSENILHIILENNLYNVMSITVKNGEIENRQETWDLNTIPFVCDASIIIIQRLMFLRNFYNNLHFTYLLSDGNKCKITLEPKETSFLLLKCGDIETIEMYKYFQYSDSFQEIRSKFSRSGYLVEESNVQTGWKVRNLKFYETNKITRNPKLDFHYSPLFIPTNDSSSKFLHNIPLCDIHEIMLNEQMNVSYDGRNVCGLYTVNMEYVHYKCHPSLFVKTEFKINTIEGNIVLSTYDILSLKLHVLKHITIETNETCGTKKILFIERTSCGMKIKQKDGNNSEDIIFHLQVDADNLMTTALHLLFQKFLSKEQILRTFKFTHINVNATICQMNLNCTNAVISNKASVTKQLYCVETTIIPYKKCQIFCKMYYDQCGHFSFGESQNMGHIIHIRPNLHFCPKIDSKLVLMDQGNISEKITFDDILTVDYAHVIYGGESVIGDNFISIEFVHYHKIPCIKIHISHVTQEFCNNLCIEAIMTLDLYTLRCTVHKYLFLPSSSLDTKIHLTWKYGAYVIEKLIIQDGKITRKVFALLSHQFPTFRHPGLDIIIVKLMALKRVESPIKIKIFDESGDIYFVKCFCTEHRKVYISNSFMYAYKIQYEVQNFNKHTVLDFHLSSEGNILCSCENNSPIITIIPSNFSKMYSENELNLERHHISNRIKCYLKNNNKIKENLKDYLKHMMENKSEDITEFSRSYFAKFVGI